MPIERGKAMTMRVEDMAGVERSTAAPMLFPGRERRRQAFGYAAWLDSAGGGAMPPLLDTAGDRAAADRGPGVLMIEFAGGKGEAAGGIGSDEWTLARLILRQASEIAAAAAPLRFSGELMDRGGMRVARGLLLPFGDARGWVVAVQAFYEVLCTAHDDALSNVVPAARIALAAERDGTNASPWSLPATSGAPAPQPVQTREERLQRARTWAALATAGPLRAKARHAALGAAHDLMLAARSDRSNDDVAPEAIVALVFGPLADAEMRTLAGALRQALRLGIAAEQLAPLLDRQPGGAEAFARETRAAKAAATESLTLEPLDGAALLASVRRPRAAPPPVLRAVA